jgi:hypothetical protein
MKLSVISSQLSVAKLSSATDGDRKELMTEN